MNRFFLLTAISALLFATSCGKKTASTESDVRPAAATGNEAPAAFTMGTKYMRSADGSYGYSEALSIDTANRMIQSYLASVGYPQQDNSLRSLVFDADVLRSYLSNPNIKSVKFMMAHQPDYIAAGNFGVNAGMNPSAITMVIVGVSSEGAYIKNGQGKVYEHFAPCPKDCPNSFNQSPIIQ
jgi:hypothetical protein